MNERTFQKNLIKEIKSMLPGCVVEKNDPNYIQGFPDITIYYKGRYAWLECKCKEEASHQPNQDFYISKGNDDGAFARFIFPENKEEVLNDLARSFQTER